MAAKTAILAFHQQAATVVSHNSQGRRRRPLSGLGAAPVLGSPETAKAIRRRAAGRHRRFGTGSSRGLQNTGAFKPGGCRFEILPGPASN